MSTAYEVLLIIIHEHGEGNILTSFRLVAGASGAACSQDAFPVFAGPSCAVGLVQLYLLNDDATV